MMQAQNMMIGHGEGAEEQNVERLTRVDKIIVCVYEVHEISGGKRQEKRRTAQ
jgi:hypothetical protein